MASRRDFLLGLGALAGAPAWVRAAPAGAMLAASWQARNGHQVGLLSAVPGQSVRVAVALDVPTRAHGLLLEPRGTLLAVARRPGDWLLRWDRSGRALAWRWIEPLRAFTGHVLADAQGRTVYTTETDLESGAGLIGVRDAATLEKRAEWPTHGIDPHQLVWDATHEGCVIVANGGVPMRPETGRAKVELERMDSSLVRIDAATGEPLAQWRLGDRRLSLRHLAWGGAPAAPLLGVALQAEHDDAGARAVAPVLALFDGHALRTVAAGVPLAGYGGDIAASRSRFAVGCPRAQGVALFDARGAWRGLARLAEACAMASHGGALWAGGRGAVGRLARDAAPESHALGALRLDNHWIALRGARG
jgi:hypothetical protein